MRSKKDWDSEAKQCEGINHSSAPTIPKEKIQAELSKSIQSSNDVAALKMLSFKGSNPVLTQLNELIPRTIGIDSINTTEKE
jgi:hypothetical protein